MITKKDLENYTLLEENKNLSNELNKNSKELADKER